MDLATLVLGGLNLKYKESKDRATRGNRDHIDWSTGSASAGPTRNFST